MENKMSTSGLAEDLIRGIVQTGCAEVHTKTLYEKAVGELENGIGIDLEDGEAVQAQLEKIGNYKDEINSLAQLRRQQMLALYNMFEGANTEGYCNVKHLGIASYVIFEAYEASDDDPELLDLAVETNKAFLRALSRFLGLEIVECAACISDLLRGQEGK